VLHIKPVDTENVACNNTFQIEISQSADETSTRIPNLKVKSQNEGPLKTASNGSETSEFDAL